MCGIVGSYSIDALIELFELNKNRGQHSWSLFEINIKERSVSGVRGKGAFDKNLAGGLSIGDFYYIGHCQAPTNGKSFETNTHPAQSGSGYLFHNGILKSQYVKILKHTLRSECNWDTKLLLEYLTVPENKILFERLSEVDGSFACVLLQQEKNPHIFRNATSPLYIDKNLNLSSNSFYGSEMLHAGKVFEMDLESRGLRLTTTFDNIDKPFFIQE